MGTAGTTSEFPMNTFGLTSWYRSSPLVSGVRPIVALLAALTVYLLLLLFPPVQEIGSIVFRVRIGTAVLMVLVFWLIYRNQGRAWEAISLALVLGLFAVSLTYKWQTAYFDGNLIGGLLPFSDARGYFIGAFRLLDGERLSVWGTRRPLFANILAVLLSCTGNNLQWSLAILVAINAVAVYLAALEVRRAFGALSAAMFTSLCYFFYRIFAGKTLTENAGFAFGALGFAFLLWGARERRFRQVSFGLFFLTLALNARAGAFFILPVLILWMAVTFRDMRAWKSLGMGCLVVLLGFASNYALIRATGSRDGVPFSNYSYTFYGLASGNKGWTQVLTDHPGVAEEDVPRLAIEKFKEDPPRLLVGMMHSYFEYLWPGRGAFGFLQLAEPRPVRWAVSGLLWVFMGLGLIAAMRQARSPVYSLLLASTAGILASIGLVPPIDSDIMRVYSATIPISIAIVSVGISSPLAWKRNRSLNAPGIFAASDSVRSCWLIGILLIGVSLIIPLITFSLRKPGTALPSTNCPSGQQALETFAGRGAFMRLIPDAASAESYLPDLRMSDFSRAVAAGSAYPMLDRGLLSLKPGQVLELTSIGFVIADQQPLAPGRQSLCAVPVQDDGLRPYDFLTVATGDPKPAPAGATALARYPGVARLVRISCAAALIVIIFCAVIGGIRQFRYRARMPMS